MRSAIDRASEELGLASWYRACVEPLMRLDESRFPSCCGAGCEPCNATLAEVALRARQILANVESGA
ncbi:MAG: hypothetical protein H5U40_13000 [Polyangiaceae bacterium]|nr:hypothetical protein [Polyangiaceae bacterium]